MRSKKAPRVSIWMWFSVAVFVTVVVLNVLYGYKYLFLTGDHGGWWRMLALDFIFSFFLFVVPQLHYAVRSTFGWVWPGTWRHGGLYLGTPFDLMIAINYQLRTLIKGFAFSTPITGHAHAAHGHGHEEGQEPRQQCSGNTIIQYAPDPDNNSMPGGINAFFQVGIGTAEEDLAARVESESSATLSYHPFNRVRGALEPTNLLLSCRFRTAERPDQDVEPEDRLDFFERDQLALKQWLDAHDHQRGPEEKNYGVVIHMARVGSLQEQKHTQDAEEAVRRAELLRERAKVIMDGDPNKGTDRAMSYEKALDYAQTEEDKASRTTLNMPGGGGAFPIVHTNTGGH